MTEAATIEHAESTINPDIEAERKQALELAGRKELAVERAGEVALSAHGGVDYATLKDLHTLAGWLCKAGPMMPPWLQNNHGGMFGICMKAHELGISPLALANWSYVVENKGVERVAYESQFFHAIIERPNGPLKTRLNYKIIGEGDERRCEVWATLKGEDEPRRFLSDTLANLRPSKNQYGQTKGSPLWEKKPELQLFYNASRDFARVFCPDVIAGMYGKDEIEDHKEHFQGPQNAKDVSPAVADISPRLKGRLTGPVGEGFKGAAALQDIEASIDAARPTESGVIEVKPAKMRGAASKAAEAEEIPGVKSREGTAVATPSSDDPVGDASGSDAAASTQVHGSMGQDAAAVASEAS